MKLQCILEKNTLKKYDLQESYYNFKIKVKIYFCELGPWSLGTGNLDVQLTKYNNYK